MCYAKPGPRCSGHAYPKMLEAKVKYIEEPSNENKKALLQASCDFFATPKGIRMLEEKAENDYSNSEKINNMITKLRTYRENQLKAFHASHQASKNDMPHNNFEANISYEVASYESDQFIDNEAEVNSEHDLSSINGMSPQQKEKFNEDTFRSYGSSAIKTLYTINSQGQDPHNNLTEHYLGSYITKVESETGTSLHTDKESLSTAYKNVFNGKYHGTATISVDPEGCGCTDCLTGESINYEEGNKDMQLLLNAGLLRDRAGAFR